MSSATKAPGAEGPGDWVLVPRLLSERMRKTLHGSVVIRCHLDKREASIMNDQAWWEAVLAAVPVPAPGANDAAELARLAELSNFATPGAWYTVDTPWGDGTWLVAGNPDPHDGTMVCDCQDVNETRPEDGPDAADDAAFIAASVNYVRKLIRSGQLVASTPGRKGAGEEKTGATPLGSGSRPSDQAASHPAPAGFDPSRVPAEDPRFETSTFGAISAGKAHSPSGLTPRFEKARSDGFAVAVRSRGWQPISTAPKDGTPILVFRDNGCGFDYYVVWWTQFDSEYPWHEESGNAYPDGRFDGWQEIISPASCDGSAEGGETEGLNPKGNSAVGEAETPAQTPPSPPSATPEGDPPMTVEEDQIESLIAIWSMRPAPGCEAGQAWEAGARQGWKWAFAALRTLHAAGEVRHG